MNKYLVITGGSQGIGAKTIEIFSAQGWRVVNISRTNCPLANVININIDLAANDWRQVHGERLLSEIQNADKICLVHNAATFLNDTVETLTENEMRAVLNVNVVSPIGLNHLLLPFMPSGSSIIYIGSTLAEQAVPGRASYVISKHALVGLMRVTCQDLVAKKIHTCCICPGFVNTEMLTANVEREILDNLVASKVIAQRLIEPEEIANFIYFCMQHPIVNGAVLHANLGQVTH